MKFQWRCCPLLLLNFGFGLWLSMREVATSDASVSLDGSSSLGCGCGDGGSSCGDWSFWSEVVSFSLVPLFPSLSRSSSTTMGLATMEMSLSISHEWKIGVVEMCCKWWLTGRMSIEWGDEARLSHWRVMRDTIRILVSELRVFSWRRMEREVRRWWEVKGPIKAGLN